MSFARLLAIASLFVLGATGHAAKIHLVLLADYYDNPKKSTDDRFAEACKNDGEMLQSVFYENVMPEEYELIQLDPYKQAKELLADLKKIEVAKDDAIVFYFSGHGYNHGTGDGYFHISRFRQKIAREEVRELLMAKQARLSVIVSDCCNNFLPPPPKSSIKDNLVKSVQQSFLKETSLLFKNLFFKTQGFVDISSCGINELSTIKTDWSAAVFTGALVSFLRNERSEGKTWKQLFDQVRRETEEQSKKVFNALPRSYKTVKIPLGGNRIEELVLKKHTPQNWGLGEPIEDSTPIIDPPPTPIIVVHQDRFGIKAKDGTQGGMTLVLATEVIPNSPAAKLGMKANDGILVFNGKDIYKVEDYEIALAKAPQKVRVTIYDSRRNRFVGKFVELVD